MTPPCDIETKLVSSQEGAFFRLDYYASPEACIYFEDESYRTSESIAEVLITNTSRLPFTLHVSSGGSLRPQSIVELDFPDRVSAWRRGPSSGEPPKQLETVVLPGMVWKSNSTRIFNPMAAIAMKNRRPLGRGFMPVELEKPRVFAVTTGFYANLQQEAAKQTVDLTLKSKLDITYVPEPEEEEPIDK